MKSNAICWIFLSLVVLVKTAAIQNEVEETDDGEGVGPDKKCPPWDKWQNSKCLWPSQEFSSLPKACTSLPKKPEIPAVIKQFIKSKQLEVYSAVQNLFKLRGAKSACGYCSRKIRCRQPKGGEFTKGCPFIQAQIVDEECDGKQACEINAILGACPPPVPIPRRPRRKPDQVHDLGDNLQKIDSDLLGDKNLEIGVDKNSTQGPPLWNCMRNQDGSKCLCCCGWYFPNAKTGKCVNIKKDETDDDDEDDQIWDWSGLMDLGDRYPWGYESAVGDGTIEQVEAPPIDMASLPVEEPDLLEMPKPPIETAPPRPEEQVFEEKPAEKKIFRETNEI